MAEMVLQDEIEPVLLARGFERSKKVFRRAYVGGVGMTVWLNPENRLRRVRTISVDCWAGGDEDGGWLYTSSQARAVSEIERGEGWASFDYAPELPGWPAVIVEDFERVTVPFIDACTDSSALCDLLLEGRIPPSNMKQAPRGWIQDAWHVAENCELPEYQEAALSQLASMPLKASDREGSHGGPTMWESKISSWSAR